MTVPVQWSRGPRQYGDGVGKCRTLIDGILKV
jgi:hypothetical protein